MTDTPQTPGGPLHRWVEAGVALFMILFGVVVVLGSLQVGIGWGDEGPKSGFFPFYLGALIVAASMANLARVIVEGNPHALFADWHQLGQVVSVIIPTTVYVFMVPWLGMYVASILLIAVFMKWFGRYGWALTLGIAVAVPAITYLLFENWFLIPLPKGPIEDLLGL
ncbi:MAG: tripartite tricarboxylate transporter TctB family protein [Xanthobacteraceae bacterium]